MQKSEVAKDVRVKYEGMNRTYLKQYPEARLEGQFSSTNLSALVQFFDKDGSYQDSAWVGLGYLELVKYTHQETIDTLTKKRDVLASELSGFDAAIKALQDLG